ncbi:hypothetical protein [Pantoea sp. C2G6]|uniref:hypothetical protein n=1 Tax=Pantoea sp. C2G6 TaxID=3243084 RepID=UPI003ED8610C
MTINAYPAKNIFLEKGVKSCLNTLPVKTNKLNDYLFLLLNKKTISEIIAGRIIENTPHYRVFILTQEQFMPLALYYLNAHPGKVSILSSEHKSADKSASVCFTTSINHLKEISPITPGEYRALELSLNNMKIYAQYERARRKTFYYQRLSALKKIGLRKINSLFV